MSCTYDKEKLTGYFDGELDAAEKADVEKHISACSECLRELGEIKSAAQLVRILPRLKAPASVAQAVTREIAPARRVDSLARYRKSILWTFAAAAALLVVANVAYFIDGSRAPENHGSTAAMPARVPLPTDTADAKPVYRETEEQLARARQVERKKEAVLPLVEEKRAAAEKGGAFGARPEPPAELAKAKEAGEQAAQGQNRGLADKAAPKGDSPKPMAAPAPTAGEPLAKKEAPAPGAAAPAAPPAPAKPAAKAEPARREVETMKQLAEGPAGGRVGGLQQDKQRDGGQAAPAALRFAVGSPQPEATRSKAEQILAKLGIATETDRANKDAAAAAPLPSQSLAVDLTPTQFEELKRQLEADSGVHLMAVVAVEEVDRLRMANATQSGTPKAPSAGLGGGAGAKNDLDGKLAESNDQKKAPEPRVDEARKADAEAKGKDEKAYKDPGQQLQAGKKAQQQESARRYVLVFLPPAAEKK